MVVAEPFEAGKRIRHDVVITRLSRRTNNQPHLFTSATDWLILRQRGLRLLRLER
jgi:hypothetical protein